MSRTFKPSLAVAFLALLLIVACGGESSGNEEVGEAVEIPPNRLIRLVDPLDDPSHYCVDVRGFGRNVRLQDSLQAHTCKPTDNRDEQFTYRADTGQIYSEEYDLCIEPESLADGSQFFLRECSSTLQQGFSLPDDGTIRSGTVGDSGLCVAVAAGPGHVINEIHKRRELFIRTCDVTDTSLMTWVFSSGAAGTGS